MITPVHTHYQTHKVCTPSTILFSSYLPFYCLFFLTLPVGAVCVIGSLLCFVVDPLQAQLCLTKVLHLSVDIDRGSFVCLNLFILIFSNLCFSALIPICASLHLAPILILSPDFPFYPRSFLYLDSISAVCLWCSSLSSTQHMQSAQFLP